MSIDLDSLQEQAGLSELLTEIVAKREVVDEAKKRLKAMEADLDRLEQKAAEQMAVSGLDGCRKAGYTWWIDEALSVSTVAANREKLIEAAKAEKLSDAITVNTATIKSFLVERAKELGSESVLDAVVGTKFDGLISQFAKVRLRSRVL